MKGKFQVFVRTLTGASIIVTVTSSDLVRSLKEKIQHQVGIPFCLQRLIFEGSQLEEAQAIGQRGLTKDSTVHLVLSLRGG
ncbi:ubiquitin, partial [Ascobolus immersus RN42]